MLDPESIVVADVGSDGGPHARWSRPGSVTVLAFDPREGEGVESCDGGPRIIERRTALADRPGRRTLYVTRKPNCSSLLPPVASAGSDRSANPKLDVIERAEIEVSTLDLEAAQAGLDRVDAIKIDVQGTELDVLRGGECALAGAQPYVAPCLLVECEVWFTEQYRGAAMFGDIHRHLYERGFEIFDLRRVFQRPPGGTRFELPRVGLTYGDALFLRTPTSLEEMMGDLRSLSGAMRRLMMLAGLYGLLELAGEALERCVDLRAISHEHAESIRQGLEAYARRGLERSPEQRDARKDVTLGYASVDPRVFAAPADVA